MQSIRWFLNFDQAYIIQHMRLIIQADTPPLGSAFNGQVNAFVHESSTPAELCPGDTGSGWTNLPFAEYCDARDYEVIEYNVDANQTQVGSVCFAYRSNGCSPASLVWRMAIRELTMFKQCPSESPTPSFTASTSTTFSESSSPSISFTASKSKSFSATGSLSQSFTPSSTASPTASTSESQQDFGLYSSCIAKH